MCLVNLPMNLNVQLLKSWLLENDGGFLFIGIPSPNKEQPRRFSVVQAQQASTKVCDECH